MRHKKNCETIQPQRRGLAGEGKTSRPFDLLDGRCTIINNRDAGARIPDDPDGNVQHIAEHDVTVEEVEEVMLDRRSRTEFSRSTGRPMTFGYTATDRHLVVIWQFAMDDPLMIYPVTAYDVPEPRQRRK